MSEQITMFEGLFHGKKKTIKKKFWFPTTHEEYYCWIASSIVNHLWCTKHVRHENDIKLEAENILMTHGYRYASKSWDKIMDNVRLYTKTLQTLQKDKEEKEGTASISSLL